MQNYKIVDGEIEVGDWFIAFGVIGKCTEIDDYYPNTPNYNSVETKWTCYEDCQKIEFIE